MVTLNDFDRQAETETAVRRRPESGRVSMHYGQLAEISRAADAALARRGLSKKYNPNEGIYERRNRAESLETPAADLGMDIRKAARTAAALEKV